MNGNDLVLTEIVHVDVLHAPSGKPAEKIAQAIGKPYVTLMNELKRQPGAKLGADLILPLMLQTGSLRPLHSLADGMGCVVIELPSAAPGLEPLSLQAFKAVEEVGKVMGEYRNAIADGVVDAAEKRRVRDKIYLSVQALMAFAATMETL